MRTLLTLALMFLAVQPQQVITARRRAPSGTCTPPTIDHRFPVSNPANTCGIGVACTNGATASDWIDIVGTVDGNNIGGVATYVSSAQNSQPGWNFHSGDQFNLVPTIAVPSVITLYWIGKIANTSGSFPMFGNLGGSNSIEWRINAGSQQLLNAGIALLVQGTATLSTTNYSTLVATFDNTTGVANVYTCAAGSCALDATLTPGTQTLTNNIDVFGTSGGDTQFQGFTVEQGVGSGLVSLPSIAAWSLCRYGI